MRLASLLLAALTAPVCAAEFASHPPMRPLPEASTRAKADGPALFVDPAKGDDGNDGSQAKPWKTLAHAIPKLKAGETLYLRGGTYYEHVTVKGTGTAKQPITIRSFPGELAVIDGGLREFAKAPATTWEPVKNSTVGEYRSVKAYPKLGGIVLGHFLDSMNTLHGYRFAHDIRSVNLFWNLTGKIEDDPKGLYCGPGLWYDSATGHIHCRLGHTKFAHVTAGENYTGQTDPRKLKLCVAGAGVPFDLNGAKHVRVQDLVIRGASRTTLNVEKCESVELDGLHVYGGSPAVMLRASNEVKLTRSCVRGISAPWAWRGGQKYRGNSAYLMTARPEAGGCKNVEIAYCELTDCHDGPYIGTIRGLRFHHNLVDNFNDDGIYLSGAGTGGDIHITQNRITRCLHCFAFAGKYKLGSGVYITRNIIDQRGEVRYQWPTSADDQRFTPEKPGGPARVPHTGFLCGDHGSPTWEKMFFYHNTVLFRDKAFRDHYGFGMARATAGTTRRVFNNVFVCTGGLPGQALPLVTDDDFVADFNLFWSTSDGPTFKGDFFAPARKSKAFVASKAKYAPGWGGNDLFADPKFARFALWGDATGDYRLVEGSPAINAGTEINPKWPDPLRKRDAGKPDLGALPLGAEAFTVGPTAGKQ
ncbi:MAG: right-handed parallel beta-helix repeat-containing protein [Planctomycetia bacterium]|nr:right-handed parallel beta-helix repeat-containing protein [Planctomycetia bacterium]